MDDWTKDFYENKATLECDICGSLLIGDEPRMVITCDECKATENSEFTDDDGNPISEYEQGRADAEADRLDKGEDE